MKHISDKRRALIEDAGPIREALIKAVGKCEICGHSPRKPNKELPPDLSALCVHEIANGPNRPRALDKNYATLVTCWACNSLELTNKRIWPLDRQLAMLLKSRPDDYDLQAFCRLLNPNAPNRIEQWEVDQWLDSD